MGRAQKLKEIRKKQREIDKKKRLKKKSRIYKTVISFALIGGLTFGGYLGYNTFLKSFTNKIKKESTKQIKTKDREEKKVDTKNYKTGERKYSKVPDMQIDINKEYTADFTTSKGNFKIKLFTKDAPKTVNNFIVLARDKFYDGLIFHRVIKDFMIQGGDPNGDGTGDPGYKFADEINSHKLVRGALAMANSGPDTNGSQFFIVTKEATPWLDGKHTVFGEVVEGLDNVMKIEKVDVGKNDKPVEDVIIKSVTIEEK